MKKARRVVDNPEDRIRMINCDRAIFVQGELDDTLFSTLTPKIIALRKNSEKPITVFIDSPGGALGAAEAIRNLLGIPDQAGRTCWINTVVTGRAWSAAAGLLTAGDYIIAYPGASIHFHGTRTSVDGITAEQAGNLQNELASMNKSMATNLATAAFNRLLLNYESVRDQMPLLRKALGKRLRTFEVLTGDGTIDVPAFVFYVFDKVRDPYKHLLMDCIHKTTRMCGLVRKFHKLTDNRRNLPSMVRGALKKINEKDDGPKLEEELSLLNVLLASRMIENPEWRLKIEDFDKLGQDFLQLNAMAYFQDEVLEKLLHLSDRFMEPQTLDFFAKHTYEDTKDPKIEKKCEEILDRAYTKIEPLWSFSFTLCRELTAGEHPISPEDAWWLGLIDEVLGSPSLTRRTIREKVKNRLLERVSIHDFDRLVDYERNF